MLKSSSNFNDEEKLLIRELFGARSGSTATNGEINE
jgi:hypothetical protein